MLKKQTRRARQKPAGAQGGGGVLFCTLSLHFQRVPADGGAAEGSSGPGGSLTLPAIAPPGPAEPKRGPVEGSDGVRSEIAERPGDGHPTLQGEQGHQVISRLKRPIQGGQGRREIAGAPRFVQGASLGDESS